MKILSFVIKEIKLFLRDPLGLIMLFLLPAIIILVIGSALNGSFDLVQGTGDKRIKMIVLDESNGEYSQNLYEKLYAIEIFEIIEDYPDRETVSQALFDKVASAAIVIPENFDDSIFLKSRASLDVILDPVLSADSVSIFMSELDKLTLSIQITALAQKNNKIIEALEDIEEIGQMIIEEAKLEYIDTKGDEVTSGLSLNQIYISSTGQTILPNIVQQTVPGWTIFGIFWIAQILALNIVQERKSGVYKRIIISPVTQTDFFMGKLIPFMAINLIQTVFLFAVGRYILPLLGCPILHIPDLFPVFIISVFISFAAISLGFLFSSICNTALAASAVSTIVLLLMTITGGIMIPSFLMPDILIRIGKLFPHYWALEAYFNVLIRESDLWNTAVPLLYLLIFGLLYSTSSIIISKSRKIA